MGGAIVAQFMRAVSVGLTRVPASSSTRPALDWQAGARIQRDRNGLPGLCRAARSSGRSGHGSTPTGTASTRSSTAEDFHLPILLFHGTDDKVVPISLSDDFAAELPRWVTYYRAPGAGHVEAWNVAPRLYERRLSDFLARTAEVS